MHASLPVLHATLMATVVVAALAGPNTAIAQETPQSIERRDLFRKQHWPAIQGQGWKFLVAAGIGTGSDADVFIQGINQRTGNIRSVWVLLSYYEQIPTFFVGKPAFQSTKAQYWVDCTDRAYEYRQGAKYPGPTGIGFASEESSLPTSQPPALKEAAPGSLLDLVAQATCSRSLSK